MPETTSAVLISGEHRVEQAGEAVGAEGRMHFGEQKRAKARWWRWRPEWRRACGQQVTCRPPERLHMLCVGGFMAVPPIAPIPHRLPGSGGRGAARVQLASWSG
ncbi:unnamed protein product [Gadus morhua 'NCC']